MLELIIQLTKLNPEDILNVYSYGSRVYGNFSANSDHDFIIVVRNKNQEQYSDYNINITFYTIDEFQNKINEHEISILECLFLPDNLILKKKIDFNFILDKSILRKSLAQKSSNSYVKVKKKLIIPEDYNLNVAQKSLFHAFRIIDFGIQICNENKIFDYSSTNTIFTEIMRYNTWNDLNNTFHERYNKIRTNFRLLT